MLTLWKESLSSCNRATKHSELLFKLMKKCSSNIYEKMGINPGKSHRVSNLTIKHGRRC